MESLATEGIAQQIARKVMNQIIRQDMKQEYPKSNGDIVSDYAIAQSKALQKCMQLDAEMAYRSLLKQEKQ